MSMQGVTNTHSCSVSEFSSNAPWRMMLLLLHSFLSRSGAPACHSRGVQALRVAGSSPRWTAHSSQLASSRPVRARSRGQLPLTAPWLPQPSHLSLHLVWVWLPRDSHVHYWSQYSSVLLEVPSWGSSMLPTGCSPSGRGRVGRRWAQKESCCWPPLARCVGAVLGAKPAWGRQAVQHSVKNNPAHLSIWELSVQDSSEEKDTSVPTGSKLYVSQKCTLAEKKTKSREEILLLHNWEDQACVQVWATWATVQLCESPHITKKSILHFFFKGIFLIIDIPSQDWPLLWVHKHLQWQTWQDGNTYHTGNAAVAAADAACCLQELWKEFGFLWLFPKFSGAEMWHMRADRWSVCRAEGYLH